MHGYVPRIIEKSLNYDLKYFPAAAVLGPRQCGKSTLVKNLIKGRQDAMYLDLESPEDLNRLENPEFFFSHNRDKLICLDEIQRRPDLFPVLRSQTDKDKKAGRFLILGSASPELLKQSSESLAGRISYEYLTPFTINEIKNTAEGKEHWLKGGYPDSVLADEKLSWRWRDNFIKTFVERDIPQLGFNISSQNLLRFLTMISHSAGSVLNRSKIGESLGLTHITVKNYTDLFINTFLVRELSPFYAKTKKRLVKSPKIYVRDTGLLHRLLGIRTFNDLLGHPSAKASWESYCVENILSMVEYDRAGFYLTSNGGGIDLVLERGKRRIAVEFKISTAPKPARGFWNGLEELGISESWIICPMEGSYGLQDGVTVSGLSNFIREKTDNE